MGDTENIENFGTFETTATNESNNPPPPSAALLARWTLNPVQTAFLESRARFSFYVGGVGAGKTTAGALRALAWALDHPGSLGLIGAPTYPMLRDATQRAFFALLDDPDRVRGLTLAWFWLDEAPLCGHYA